MNKDAKFKIGSPIKVNPHGLKENGKPLYYYGYANSIDDNSVTAVLYSPINCVSNIAFYKNTIERSTSQKVKAIQEQYKTNIKARSISRNKPN